MTDNGPGGQNTLALSGTGIDFSIAAAGGSSSNVTVTAGQTATYNLSLSPEGGLSGSVSLTCTGAPSEVTCSVTPASVMLDGSNSTAATVTVTTTAASVVLVRRTPRWPMNRMLKMPTVVWLLAVLLVWAAAQVTLVSEPKSNSRLAMAALVGSVFLLAACGGGGGGGATVHNPGTPPGTYSILVTGTFGTGATSAQHSITLTLKVN